MAPSKDLEGHNGNDVSRSLSGEDVVISGISGVFPNSDSVLDFMNNLYNKVDMVTSEEPKWKLNDPDVPKHMGAIKGTDKFDAQFFGVTFQLACALEPMGRKLLEHVYGAILDSGTSPQSLRGKRVGVFVGSSFTDDSALSMFNINKRSDFIVNGCSKAMLANRISYWIDGKGPSYTLDYACSSSAACLEIAYKSIKSGECDAAIVGGCNYGVHPNLTLNLRRAGLLCLDGKTKCFDKNADGYVRADAINVIFLQKAEDAHRIGSIINVIHVHDFFHPLKDNHSFSQNLKEYLNGLIFNQLFYAFHPYFGIFINNYLVEIRKSLF